MSSEQAGTEQRSLGLSYSHTPSARPLLGVTIGRQLEWAAARAADRDAFVFTKLGVRLSFAELLKKVRERSLSPAFSAASVDTEQLTRLRVMYRLCSLLLLMNGTDVLKGPS